jgi:hypothetical protein
MGGRINFLHFVSVFFCNPSINNSAEPFRFIRLIAIGNEIASLFLRVIAG